PTITTSTLSVTGDRAGVVTQGLPLHGSQRRFSLARTPMCEYGWSCGVGVSDDRVEAVDEGGVATGFVVPAAALGVFGECFRVGALGGEYREHCGLGAEVGAVLADVGVGADA